MTKEFAQGFVRLSRKCLASEIPAKLRFGHTERGFNIRPLVIMMQELSLIHRTFDANVYFCRCTAVELYKRRIAVSVFEDARLLGCEEVRVIAERRRVSE
jgi:hypothetical protein